MSIEFELTPTMQQIRDHRSVRVFKSDPIPDGWVETIIETAQWASSTCFRQVYSVIAVTEADTKHVLMKLCGGQKWVEQCPVFLVFCADLNRTADICRANGTQVTLEHTETFLSAVLDVGLLMQNAALAAESLGLGQVMIGGIRDNPRDVIKLLALPEAVFAVSGMCLGFPTMLPPQRPRLPLAEVLHRERYQTEGRPDRLAAYDESIRAARTYRRKDGSIKSWTEVMATNTSRAPEDERVHLVDILREQGFEMK